MSIIIGSFVKGWQNRANPSVADEEGLVKVVDLSLDTVGALVCRDLHGLHPYLSSLSETDEIKNLFVVYVEGVDVYRIYYTVGQTLYRWVSATNVATSIATNIGTARVSYAVKRPQLADYTHVYITNGSTMLCDDGIDYMTWGIDPPDNVLTIKDSGLSGQLSAGGYRYVYTFYDTYTGAESDPSNACAALTVADNASIDITNMRTSSNSRVNARRLYRTVADGGSYYLVATITDNVTTYFVDTLADNDLTLRADTDQGIPPTASIAMTVDDFVFLAGDINHPNRIWFSKANYPDNFPSTYYVNLGGSGNRIKMLKLFEEKAYVVTAAGVAGITGSDPDNFVPRLTRAQSGTYVGESVATGPDGLFYLGHDGVYHFDTAQTKRISDQIMKLFGHTVGTWYDIVDKDQAESVAKGVCLNGKYYLLLPLRDSSGTTTNGIVVYDSVDKVWSYYDVACVDIFADQASGTLFGSMLKYGSTTEYTVYELFKSGRSSVDSPSPEFVTKDYDITDAGEHSRAKKELTSSFKVRGGQEIGTLRKYRVDATGTWTFEFYVDDVLRFSQTHSGLGSSDLNTWHSFSPELKGRYLTIRGIAGGTKTPSGCVFNQMEVK